MECLTNESCPESGKMFIPFDKKSGEPSCPQENWNSCQFKIEYNGNLYDYIDNTENNDCNSYVNNTRDLYYHPDLVPKFQEHDDQLKNIILMIIAICAFILISTLVASQLLKNNFVCHTTNTLHAVSTLSRMIRGK